MRIGRLMLAGLLIALTAAGAGTRRGAAQSPNDRVARYRPALLPDFLPDLNAHPTAPHYTIDMQIALDDRTATITGQQSVRYTNRAPGIALDDIVFRLYPNLDSYGAAMAVHAVTVDGHAVTPALDATRSVLSVPLPQPLPAGAAVTLDLAYAITVEAGQARLYGQFSYLDGILALPHAYPMLAVYRAGRGWWDETAHPQGDIVFSETAFYDVRVTAPADVLIAASGTPVSLDTNTGGTLTHHIVAPLMRDFALIASARYVTLGGEQDGVRLTLYYDPDRPNAHANARAGLRIAQNALHTYNAAFGRYPYAELDIVQTPNSAGGLEYPGLFVIGTDVWDAGDALFEFLIAHEMAHQWWYGLVGNDQVRDPWLDEALAQFATAIYIRAQEGEDAYAAALESFRIQHANFTATHPDQRIGRPVPAYPDRAYFFIVYQKGPLFYAALDDAYGTEAVLAALRDFLAAHRYGIAYPDDLRASLERSLGADLGALFAEWVAPLPVG